MEPALDKQDSLCHIRIALLGAASFPHRHPRPRARRAVDRRGALRAPPGRRTQHAQMQTHAHAAA